MIVTTPIKNLIAIKNAINKTTVTNVRQTHATHSKEIFLLQAVVIFPKLFFDVGSTLIKIQRESEKTVRKIDFK